MTLYCLDASVVVNSNIPKESHYAQSKQLMQFIMEQGAPVVMPELVFPEIAWAIARGTGHETYAMALVNDLRDLPAFVFVPLDRQLAQIAARLAARFQLRGSDAVYVATASTFSATLITLDRQQQRHAARCLEVRSPSQELQLLGLDR